MGCRKKLSLVGRPIAFFSALWMVADIILDYLTVKEYKDECERIDPSNNSGSVEEEWLNGVLVQKTTNGYQCVHWLYPVDIDIGIKFSSAKADITCLLWPLGALSMVLPTVAMVLYIGCCGGPWRPWWEKVAYGPFYFISSPVYAVMTSFIGLCCASSKMTKKKAAHLKLAEILFESLPQVTITATYLYTKGMPWQRQEGNIDSNITVKDLELAGKTWLPFISGIWGVAMIIIGTVTGAMAGAELEQNSRRRRKEEQEHRTEIKLKQRELKQVWNTGDDEAYDKFLSENELLLMEDPEMKTEKKQIAKLRKRRGELEAKANRNKREDIEHEKIKTKLRNLHCTEMRKNDKHITELKEKRTTLENNERNSEEENEYANIKKELMQLGCPDMKEDFLEIIILRKESAKLKKKKRSLEEEETYEFNKKELRKFGCPEMRKSDERMAELNIIWSDLTSKERGAEEEREFESTKLQLRRLGCVKMRARDEEMTNLWQRRTVLKEKVRNLEEDKEYTDAQDKLRQFGCPQMRKKDDEEMRKLREKISTLKKKEWTAEEETEYELIKNELRRLGCPKMKKSYEKLVMKRCQME